MTLIERLHKEFAAEDADSFLIRLRGELFWDRAAFRRLVDAMQEYLASERNTEDLQRQTAEGFWYLDWYVKEWSSHPNFPKVFPQSYYESAYERLHDLAYWYFFGESPCETGTLAVFDA
ncbi:MAG: hypothetical protein IT473_13755 [Lysobacter sp.]|nr:hypothetical protein [Lysobacter sp.]